MIHPIPCDARIDALLSTHRLPTSDLGDGTTVLLFGWTDGDRLRGVVGLELFDGSALLRSLVVPDAERGNGLGATLVAHAEHVAIGRGADAIYLLTETAEAFFGRLGYQHAARVTAPPAIAGTTQFSRLCPASSSFMTKRLRS